MYIPRFLLLRSAAPYRPSCQTGINLIIVRNIVSFVGKRGLVARGKPDNINTQVIQIVQFTDNAREISDTVAIGIIKTFWINLISYFVVPPFFVIITPPYVCAAMQNGNSGSLRLISFIIMALFSKVLRFYDEKLRYFDFYCGILKE